jgi:hypothetical protein
MKVYDGASWIAATSAGNVSLTTYQYTATGGQTTFSGSDDNAATLSYTVNNILVTLNGSLLYNGTDYTATNGTSIVLSSGATASDVLQVTSFKSFTTADMVPASTGGTFSGNVNVTGNFTVDTNTLYVDSSSNTVGIGTSSPSAPLTVQTSSTTSLDIKTTAVNGTAQARFSNDARTYSLGIDNSDSFFVYDATGASTRMTIDSSGNLLVGGTNVDPASANVDGTAIGNSGYVSMTRDNGAVGLFNRKTSDGDILELFRNGGKVGSIGSNAGAHLTMGSGDTGLLFNAATEPLLDHRVVSPTIKGDKRWH